MKRILSSENWRDQDQNQDQNQDQDQDQPPNKRRKLNTENKTIIQSKIIFIPISSIWSTPINQDERKFDILRVGFTDYNLGEWEIWPSQIKFPIVLMKDPDTIKKEFKISNQILKRLINIRDKDAFDYILNFYEDLILEEELRFSTLRFINSIEEINDGKITIPCLTKQENMNTINDFYREKLYPLKSKLGIQFILTTMENCYKMLYDANDKITSSIYFDSLKANVETYSFRIVRIILDYGAVNNIVMLLRSTKPPREITLSSKYKYQDVRSIKYNLYTKKIRY